MGDAPCKLPLILIVAHKSYIVNRQIGDADYKYVVSDDPLSPGHVTRRMRIANFAIKWPIYIAFIRYSATDQARSIKFSSKYV